MSIKGSARRFEHAPGRPLETVAVLRRFRGTEGYQYEVVLSPSMRIVSERFNSQDLAETFAQDYNATLRRKDKFP